MSRAGLAVRWALFVGAPVAAWAVLLAGVVRT